MHVLRSLGHKNLQLLLAMHSPNKHLMLIMLKWGIFSSHIINIQWTKCERKSTVTFISEELP